jgi:Nucleotidyl transferase of unknown function (DUF2204)
MTASAATLVRAAQPAASPNEFHRKSVTVLQAAKIPFLIGGAYVVKVYAGVPRSTKDFDLYIRPSDVNGALDALAQADYETELTFPHWLAKATYAGDMLDLIFRAGNGLCEVDDSWFERARDHELLGMPVKLCAPEEMIWMKAFIMERERFDGADIAHILRCWVEEMDWPRLIWRFGPDWRVLLSHLILFGYVYPGERARIPVAVIEQLIARLRSETKDAGPERLCRGTLLSRQQYLVDVQEWGFRDARLKERVQMNAQDIADWTEAIGKQE